MEIKIVPNKLSLFILLILLVGFIFVPKSHASDLNIPLTSVSDTVTTSRPSVAATLSANLATGASQAQIGDPGTMNNYLASDSALIYPDIGETIDAGVLVSSMSAANTPVPGHRLVYFSSTWGHNHHIGDTVIVNVTAMHTISFKTTSQIPASGKIILTFPGASAVTIASPSATTFSFNGLTSANATSYISYNLGGANCSSFVVATSGQTPTITCNVNGTINASTVVTFLIGCGDSATAESACATQKPLLINPTKTNANGTTDVWKVLIKTTDAGSNGLDLGTASIGINESVQVQAQVDPTLTFSIAPVNNGVAINTNNTISCTNSTDATNTGITPTSTNVNLGLLSAAQINVAAQLITVSTNASGGYALTATSSGHLINSSNGVWIADSTTPVTMTAGTPWYGIHPCGVDVTAIWYTTNPQSDTIAAGAKFGWPTSTSPLTLASRSPGPIGIAGTGNGKSSIMYASTVDASIPAGIYTTVVTYVATPTF